MKTFLLTLALLAACCTASTPSEYRNLTTTEIDYCSHVQTLIPTGLNKILETNELQNQFNTTDFVLDKINFVSQKEFKKGYIYKINVDFINSAGEIAHTQFLGIYKNKSRKLSVHSLTYTVEYPQMDYDLEEEFKPSPINGTHSTGIFKDLRNYIQENFNKTQDILLFRNTTTMYNSTYLPQDLNMSSTYDAPQNYSSGSYNNTWMNKTYSEYSGPQRLNNTAYNSNSSHNNTWVNKTYSGYSGLQRLNNTANRTNTAYNSSSSYNNTWMNKTYSEYYGPERTNNTNYLSYNETASNATSSYNITEAVYKSLNMLVDMFNSTDLEIEEIEVDLEPLIGTVFEFVSKSLEESFDIQFGKIIDKLIDFEPSSETMPAIPKKHKSVFT